MDAMEAIKQTYFMECEELLVTMEEGLLAMDGNAADDDVINAVFRAVHSIKGGGGAFGMMALVGFAHAFETVLDRIRAKQLAPEPDVVKVLLRAGDVLADHVNAARHGAVYKRSDSETKAALEALSTAEAAVADDSPLAFEEFEFTPARIDIGAPAPVEGGGWRIRFAPHATLYAKANEPALLIRELRHLGPCEVTVDLARLPHIGGFEKDQAYLAWDIALKAGVSREQIDEIFEFVVDDCDLAVEPVLATVAAAALPREADGGHTEALDAPAAMVANEPSQSPSTQAIPSVKPTIRVDLDKVDRLVNIVGELVITQAMLALRAAEDGLARRPLIAGALGELDHQLRDLQESVMAIRTQPVKSVFQRMPRLARELAAQTNKAVRLVIEGEATEVDKTVVERLGEPLTHMIRNAVDHGFEPADEREALGKPAEGTITLSAEHRGGRIVIEISDDGRGIDRERVRAKAVEKGLVAATAILSDEETDNLIFLPGFSTANQVSDISGRGVGMDVVRQNIVDLGGRVVIASTPKKGSRFSLTLPLTLAVLDGMVVGVGAQTYVLPLSHIVESLRPKPGDIRPFGRDSAVLNVRNSYVPLITIAELLGIEGAQADPASGVVILVESDGAGRVALAVDAILGQRQVVIKSFETNYRPIAGIAAATILGDGTVALILDVDGLVSRCRVAAAGRGPIAPIAATGG